MSEDQCSEMSGDQHQSMQTGSHLAFNSLSNTRLTVLSEVCFSKRCLVLNFFIFQLICL